MYDSRFCLLQQNQRFSLWIYLAMVFSSVLQLDSQPLPYTGIFAQELSRGEFSKAKSPKVILDVIQPIYNEK